MHQTALDSIHRSLGARMVPFGGWDMPVQYTGIVEEHQAVRQAAGLFDLSHMGELHVQGLQAAAALDYALVTTPSKLAVGRAHYSMIASEEGAILDDLIVYRLKEEHFLIVSNASNTPTVVAALKPRLTGFSASLDDATMRTSLVAVQGPRTVSILQPLTDHDLADLKYYSIVEARVAGVAALLARTGYTGEDGFEVIVAWDDAAPVWEALMQAGAEHGLIPCGLGARDTLRLEAGMPLYGQELSAEISPFEAGLGRVVKFDKPGDFVGREALKAGSQHPARHLVGLKLIGRGIPRTGYPVYLPAAGNPVGVVTSGTVSPTLGVSIAMAYLPAGEGAPGSQVEVGIRNQRVPAEVITLPFYKRSV